MLRNRQAQGHSKGAFRERDVTPTVKEWKASPTSLTRCWRWKEVLREQVRVGRVNMTLWSLATLTLRLTHMALPILDCFLILKNGNTIWFILNSLYYSQRWRRSSSHLELLSLARGIRQTNIFSLGAFVAKLHSPFQLSCSSRCFSFFLPSFFFLLSFHPFKEGQVGRIWNPNIPLTAQYIQFISIISKW